MFIAIVLLSLLFIGGLFCTLLNPQTKKLMVWFKSLFPSETKAIPQVVELESNNPNVGHERVVSVTKSKATQDKAELKKVFATFDKNDDGFITKHELRASLRNIGIHKSEAEVADMVEKVDSNGDGLIDLEEFCELFEGVVGEEERGGGGESELKEAFDVFDGDRDGLITVEELGMVLSSLGMKEGKVLENCKEMIRQVDVDGDGMVNFEEFKRMMRAGGGIFQVS